MNCAALKLRWEFSFYWFTGEEGGVAKTLNYLYVRSIIKHIVINFECLSLNTSWVKSVHTNRETNKPDNIELKLNNNIVYILHFQSLF